MSIVREYVSNEKLYILKLCNVFMGYFRGLKYTLNSPENRLESFFALSRAYEFFKKLVNQRGGFE